MNYGNDNELNEFVKFYPMGLSSYLTIPELDLNVYSNTKITNTFINWVEKDSILKPVRNVVIDGINQRKIVIGYESKNKIKRLYKILRNSFYNKNQTVLGWYSGNSNKIALILDDNVNIIGNVIKEITPVLSHELAHYACKNNYKGFIKGTYSKYMEPFYKVFINDITDGKVNPSDKEIKKLVTNLIKKNEASGDVFVNNNIKTCWKEIFTNYPEYYLPTISSYMYMREYIPFNNNVRKSIRSLMKAYETIGIKNVLNFTLPGQEIAYPSEILSVVSTFGTIPEIGKIVNQIKF